jgi:bifunctional non-homologous end joining protein LigD
MPATRYDPQKALLVDEPPSGSGWLHELKLDGFRMGLVIDGDSVRIISRRGNEYTADYPEIVDAARGIAATSAIIDGEIVVLDEKGIPSFERLQQLRQSRRGLTYFAFDLLELDGERLEREPLIQRKARLEATLASLPSASRIRYTTHFETEGAAVFQNACALGAEGIVSKRRDGPYRSGVRSADWQKTKCAKRQEFVVGGFTDPEGSRSGIGSLLVGYYEDGALRFAGKVGTGRGWTARFSEGLRKQLEEIEQRATPFKPRPPGWLGKNAHWVHPNLVVEVSFAQWTSGGHVRHPTLLGFRDDKEPTEVVREREVTPPVRPKKTEAESRLLFPRIHVGTREIAEVYTRIVDAVLPHVVGRPLTLVRVKSAITREDALRTQAAFVHHTAKDQAFVNDAVPRIRIKEQKKIGEYCYIDSAEALVALVEAGVVEWHTWNARVDDVERPDRVIFDLDPGDGVDWKTLIGAARSLRQALEKRGLESWVKTTGGKGLHVVVPFERDHGWDDVFEFSKDVASALAIKYSRLYTLSFDRADRDGKVLIDYKRNYRTSIAVAAFSTRARPTAPLSVPVSWTELGRLGASDRWTIATIEERLRRQKSDPWAEFWTARQRLPLPG